MVASSSDNDESPWASRTRQISNNKPFKFGLQAVAALVAWQACKSLGRALGLLATPASSRGSAAAAQTVQALDEGVATVDEPQGEQPSARQQWLPNSETAPAVPAQYKLSVEADLSISVYDFYEHFLSNDSSTLQDHYRCGTLDFKATRWRQEGNGLSRTLTFVQPKQGVQPCDVPCRQQQRLAVYADSVLIFSSTQDQFASPYCDCYQVCCFWRVQPDATHTGCKVSIYVGVIFSRSPLVRSLIQSTAFKASKAFFSNYLDKVKSSIETEMLATTVSLALNSSAGDPNPELLRRLAAAAHNQHQLLDRQPSGTMAGGGWGPPTPRTQAGAGSSAAGPGSQFARPSSRVGSKPSFTVARHGAVNASMSGSLGTLPENRRSWHGALQTMLLLVVLVMQLLLAMDNMQLRRRLVVLHPAVLDS